MRKQRTVRTLNRLVRTCRDGEALCRTLSGAAESVALSSSLRLRGEEWARQGDELQALVLALNGGPETRGTPDGWLSRARLAVRSAVLGPSDLTTIEEWQRMQQRALHLYEEALSRYLPERVRRTVRLQADRIEGRSSQIGNLRGQYALPTHGA